MNRNLLFFFCAIDVVLENSYHMHAVCIIIPIKKRLIVEKIIPMTICFQLSASDEDVGLNRDVEYSIVSDETGSASSTQFFNIDSRTGIITTSTALVSVGTFMMMIVVNLLLL
jgi:hypothetical protein